MGKISNSTNKNKGFTLVEVLLLIVVLILVGGLGYLGFKQVNKKSKTSTSSTAQKSATQNTKGNVATTTKLDTTVHEVNIKLQTEADISKLPDYTPSSFKAYMLDLLKNNKLWVGVDGVAYTTKYSVLTISQVNILGGMIGTDKDGNVNLAGGAPALWVLTPAGTWDTESLNGPFCKSKNGGLIYEEFVKQCSNSSGDLVNNPNGSITSLAQ
jgi:Tfp pilus assembly protein PilE